jgi:hypothetical protein
VTDVTDGMSMATGPAPGPASPPRKLFREDATAASSDCQNCGAPIELHTYGGTERIICAFCGSAYVPSPKDTKQLEIVERANRARRQSMLPLYARGKLDGATWEIVGIMWRETKAEGTTYPWQEFLLFNPYKGYRWLVYDMSTSHWLLAQALDGAPRAKGGALTHKSVSFRDKRYRHFQSGDAVVTYVEGEFTWQVEVGDRATTHDYVLPPHGISIEETSSAGGEEVQFSSARHLDANDVWAAFKQPGAPPPPKGVGMLRPNPWRQQARAMWVSFAALFIAWIVTTGLYTAGRADKVVFDSGWVPLAELNQTVELGAAGTVHPVEVKFAARPLSNAWAYGEIMLVNTAKEEAIGLGIEVDEYNGVDGGESWREGDPERSQTIGAVEGGSYLLQIKPQAAPTNTPNEMRVMITRDPVLGQYIVIPFLVIVLFPLINAIGGAVFEGRRWQNSDYASSGS